MQAICPSRRKAIKGAFVSGQRFQTGECRRNHRLTAVRNHKGRDPRGVRLEGQRQQILHNADVLLVILRDRRRFGVVRTRRNELLCLLEALFDFVHGRHVFVEFAAVGDTQVGLQLPGIVQNEIEDALVVQFAPGAAFLQPVARAVGEQPLENQPGIESRRQRRRLQSSTPD